MQIKTYPPNNKLPANVVLPTQTHGTNIIKIETGGEDLSDGDGLWTTHDTKWHLGVRTADCAPIVFWDDKKYGVIHAGWRGLCDGIVEKMCEIFKNPSTNIWVGPLLPVFEIQRDDCYDQIEAKFGTQFFTPLDKKEQEGVLFHFKEAIAHLLPRAEFDQRSTYDTLELASWRRDHNDQRNVTIITP